MFATYHQMCQPTISSSTVSTSRRADALPPTGSIHLVGQGRPGYNRWKRITGAQSTCCGHRHMIARWGGRYDPCWSSAAVSEWVSIWLVRMQSYHLMIQDLAVNKWNNERLYLAMDLISGGVSMASVLCSQVFTILKPCYLFVVYLRTLTLCFFYSASCTSH